MYRWILAAFLVTALSGCEQLMPGFALGAAPYHPEITPVAYH